ncbi:hypothetical protein OG292_36595 [Streptomyces sp. NBC_01511]|uniref:hypothetical protein n=1 Tax=unclassified Streptomyces TaxID=2593676 RepID=UPI00386E0A51
MGLLPTVLISLVFPALMLFVMVALGRMEELLLPHLQPPRPTEGEPDAPPQDAPIEDTRQPASGAESDLGPDDGLSPEEVRAEAIRAAQTRADIARARTEAVRRSARRRAYGTPRPVGRTNTGPPRGGRTTPLRFR